MSDTIVLVTERDHIGKLVTLLRLDQANLTALVVGDRDLAEEAAKVASDVKWIDSDRKPAEVYSASAAAELARLAPKVAVAVATPGSRAALGLLAAEWGASTISNATALKVEDGLVTVEHSVLDDKIIETVEMESPAVVLVNPLALQADETSKVAFAEIDELPAEDMGAVDVVSVDPLVVSAVKDAEIVVAVGRGVGEGESFEAAKRFADSIGAEIGCSMPVASELKLLPLERYVGISGNHIEPKLYIALGISGLAHHIAGMKNSRAIVVVNKDPKAFFFENADYGIVGDVAEVIPELERAFSTAM